jgi:hypothetical protein
MPRPRPQPETGPQQSRSSSAPLSHIADATPTNPVPADPRSPPHRSRAGSGAYPGDRAGSGAASLSDSKHRTPGFQEHRADRR